MRQVKPQPMAGFGGLVASNAGKRADQACPGWDQVVHDFAERPMVELCMQKMKCSLYQMGV